MHFWCRLLCCVLCAAARLPGQQRFVIWGDCCSGHQTTHMHSQTPPAVRAAAAAVEHAAGWLPWHHAGTA